jgi:hypothetical protein
MRYKVLAILAVLALVVTFATVTYQRRGVMEPAGWEGYCLEGSPCMAPILGAGFPIPFLVDNPGVSVVGVLDFFEDEFHPSAFIQDALIYFGLGLLIVLLNFYRMKNS